MQIYLPIAETSVNIFAILGIGGLIGILSGLFGVGGGFLMTPLLIFIGVPPAVAVATGANQIVATSVSGVLAHWRRGNVDVKMGLILLAGGVTGSSLGVWLFTVLRQLGYIELIIQLCFVVFLGAIGFLMLIESIQAMVFRFRLKPGKRHRHLWLHGLPGKMRFRRSQLYISALLPLAVGLVVGGLTAIMGVGGGFIMVPAMIYVLGMPTQTVVGTSLFQVIFVTINVTILQAVANQSVDTVLAMLLLSGGVVGAQFGARFGGRLRSDHLRGLLAILVLAVWVKLVFDLTTAPADAYSIGTL